MLLLLKPYCLDLGLSAFFDLLHLHKRTTLVSFGVEAHGVVIGFKLKRIIPCSVCPCFLDRSFAAAHRANLSAGDWLALVAFDPAFERGRLRTSDVGRC